MAVAFALVPVPLAPLQASASAPPLVRAPPLVAKEQQPQGDGLGGAVSASLNELFSSFFKPDEEKQAEIDRAYAEQLEVAARRKNPKASAEYMRATEKRRRESSAAFADKFAWQRGKEDPLVEWKKRQKEGKLNPLGYEDEPKGGIPMPMASFGVGGEFGVGGKYDNGERFDLRLPYAEQGWVEGEDDEQAPGFFENLLSGGKLQRAYDEMMRQKRER